MYIYVYIYIYIYIYIYPILRPTAATALGWSTEVVHGKTAMHGGRCKEYGARSTVQVALCKVHGEKLAFERLRVVLSNGLEWTRFKEIKPVRSIDLKRYIWSPPNINLMGPSVPPVPEAGKSTSSGPVPLQPQWGLEY